MSDFFCVELPEIPEPITINLPGGVSIKRINLKEAIDQFLTPIFPVLKIIDAIMAIKNCFTAVADALGPPPDPTKLAACLEELEKAFTEIAKLNPATWGPLLVVSLIDCVIAIIVELRNVMVHLGDEINRNLRLIERAKELNDSNLMQEYLCAETNLKKEAYNQTKALKSLGALINLLNLFMGLFGGPQVPDLTSLEGKGIEELIEPIDKLIGVLQTIRGAVPV